MTRPLFQHPVIPRRRDRWFRASGFEAGASYAAIHLKCAAFGVKDTKGCKIKKRPHGG